MKVLLVAILLIGVFGFVGGYTVYCNVRIKNLKQIYDFISVLKVYICDERLTFENALKKYIELSDDNITDIPEKCYSSLLNNKPLCKAWNFAVDNTDNCVCENDKKMIKSVSSILGVTDIQGQMASFRTLQDTIKERIVLYENYKKNRLTADCTLCISLIMIVSFVIL